jgi:hypothetical protein
MCPLAPAPGSFNGCVTPEKPFAAMTGAKMIRALRSGHLPESGNLNPDFVI